MRLCARAPLVWPQFRSNVAFETTLGDRRATEKAFAKAARVVTLDLVNQRLIANYLDTRAVVAEYDAGANRLTLTLSSQGSHLARDVLGNDVLRIAPETLRVFTPDVGGGFGAKLFPYREYALAAVAARKLARPVVWIAERGEHFLADAQGRDNITRAKLALEEDGRFLALDVDLVADMGAYLSFFAPPIPFIGAEMLPGVYDIAACHIRIRGAYTNTVPVDAYRGAGRPEAAYVIERLVDAAVRELSMEPNALRRRNFIKPNAMPYTTATRKVYDSGEFAGHLKQAQEAADWKGFRRRLAASRKAGRRRGIGMATYIEACGSNGPDTATVRLEREGSITVLIGSQSTGQGHHTAYAQIVAEHLGLPADHVRIVQGDTDAIASGPVHAGTTHRLSRRKWTIAGPNWCRASLILRNKRLLSTVTKIYSTVSTTMKLWCSPMPCIRRTKRGRPAVGRPRTRKSRLKGPADGNARTFTGRLIWKRAPPA